MPRNKRRAARSTTNPVEKRAKPAPENVAVNSKLSAIEKLQGGSESDGSSSESSSSSSSESEDEDEQSQSLSLQARSTVQNKDMYLRAVMMA